VASSAQTACRFDDEGEDGEEGLVCFFVDYGRGSCVCWSGALFFSMRHKYCSVFTEFNHDGELTGLLAHMDSHCDNRSDDGLVG
jgi:hypothetical protein